MKTILAVTAGALLLVSGAAQAREEHQHGKSHAESRMAKLHKMMPRYAKAGALIEASLDKGDLKGVTKQTDYLLSTTADLKKSKPHKNVAQLAEFQKIAAEFELDVNKVAESAKAGDIAGARAAFASAKDRCNSCHTKFKGR